MKLIKIYENNQFYNGLETDFLQLLNSIAKSSAYNAHMYEATNYKIENHLRIDGLFYNEQCVAFSGIYREPTWPTGVYRTHSRLWIAGAHRKIAFTSPFEIDEAGPIRSSTFPEPSFIAKYLIGPIHRELIPISKALFISFTGLAEIKSINTINNVHKYLWNDGLDWRLQENILINNETRTIIYTNVEKDYNLLHNI